VKYQSTLEARWAAFFDLCNWDHKYEPVLFKGWKPDFVLFDSIYVEIKPFSPWSSIGDECFATIQKAVPDGPCVLMGLGNIGSVIGRCWIKSQGLVTSRMRDVPAILRSDDKKKVLGSRRVAYHKVGKCFDHGLSSHFGSKFSPVNGSKVTYLWNLAGIVISDNKRRGRRK